MLVAAAIKLDGNIYTGIRHCNILGLAENYGLGFGGLKRGIQGFVDDDGNFYDREEAKYYAMECGQISILHRGQLLSEKLW